MLKPTASDPIQNRKLSHKCWNLIHFGHRNYYADGDYVVVGCNGWDDKNGDRCECLCHEATPNPKVKKLKPSDSLDLPDVGTITVGP